MAELREAPDEEPKSDIVIVTAAGEDPDERPKRLIALLIASVAVLGALLAYLKTDASAHADLAKRESRRLAVEAAGYKISSEAQAGFALDAARVWLQMGKLEASANKSGPLELPDLSSQSGDSPELAPVNPAAWYAGVKSRIAELSPLLAPPYNGDYRKYYAETALVQGTLLTEQSTAASHLDEQWGSKSGGYVLELAVLAVALALLGLSTTMRGQQRAVCLVVGSAIVLVTLGSAVVTYLSPVHLLSDSAMAAYSRGVGEAYQGESADKDVAAHLNQTAIKSFDEALALEPTYASALFDKGKAQYSLRDYGAAASSYEAALATGRDDTAALWNLGWTYYLLGRYTDADRLYRQALAEDGNLVAVRLNLGLSLLAQGKVDDADKEYGVGLEKAAELVAKLHTQGAELPYSFWHQLDRAAIDLNALADSLDGHMRAWEEAPPPETIATGPDVRERAALAAARLKSASVALEYTGKLPVGTGSASAEPFGFTYGGGKGPNSAGPSTPFESGMTINLQGQTLMPPDATADATYSSTIAPDFITNTITYDPDNGNLISMVTAVIDYSGIPTGSQIVWKVFKDGEEDHSLRRVETWKLASAGSARKPISFVFQSTGEYRVEMYVNSHFVQSGTLHVNAPDR